MREEVVYRDDMRLICSNDLQMRQNAADITDVVFEALKGLPQNETTPFFYFLF